MGVIGGRLGYQLLRRLGGSPPRRDLCSGAAYRDRSKLEVLLGPGIWRNCADKVVLDFGCGTGDDAVEIAQRGARRVIGLDIRESVLKVARQRAREAGVADRCVFATQAPEPVDVVVSLDGFEHYADPGGALASMTPPRGCGITMRRAKRCSRFCRPPGSSQFSLLKYLGSPTMAWSICAMWARN